MSSGQTPIYPAVWLSLHYTFFSFFGELIFWLEGRLICRLREPWPFLSSDNISCWPTLWLFAWLASGGTTFGKSVVTGVNQWTRHGDLDDQSARGIEYSGGGDNNKCLPLIYNSQSKVEKENKKTWPANLSNQKQKNETLFFFFLFLFRSSCSRLGTYFPSRLKALTISGGMIILVGLLL